MVKGLSRRLGKISIPRDLYLETWRAVSDRFLPLDVDFFETFGEITVVAESELFEELPEGEILPFYNVTITENDKGEVVCVTAGKC